MGDVGSGKSSICEKLTSRTGLSSYAEFSFTKNSKVYVVDNIHIADTPGLLSSTERLDHALNLLGALRYQPVTSLLFICPCKDRIDGIIDYVDKIVGPFMENFANNIAVIVTKHDLQPQLSKASITTQLTNLGIQYVFVSDKNTPKKGYVDFLSSIQATPVDVTIAPVQLTSYLNLVETDLKMRSKYSKYVKHYKDISLIGKNHLQTLTDEEQMDFAFSFKAFMMDLIGDFQKEFTNEVQGDEHNVKFLLWTQELAKEMKRELLGIRILCRQYIKTNANHNYRKCPYCGNVWALVEGCKGNTTCGSMPSLMDSENQSINVLRWNWKEITSGFDFKKSSILFTRSVLGGNNLQSGKNPELTKPCGNTIAFKKMVPVLTPPEWNFEQKETVTDVAELGEGQ